MNQELSEADRAFLAAAAEDIARRLRGVAVVESIGTGTLDANKVTVVVTVRAGSRRLVYRGEGESLIDAYRALLVAAIYGPHVRDASVGVGSGTPPSPATPDRGSPSRPETDPSDEEHQLSRDAAPVPTSA